MAQKIYVVVETYRDYKNASSYVWGASESKEKAKEIMINGIKQRYEYMLEDEDYDFDSFYKSCCESDECWCDDNCDDTTEFSIREVEVY